MDYINILIGLGAGVGSALVGYIKNLPEGSSNKIDFWKAAPTVILGGIAGVYAGYYNISLVNAEAIVFTTATITLANQGVLFIRKWYQSRKLINSNIVGNSKKKKNGNTKRKIL